MTAYANAFLLVYAGLFPIGSKGWNEFLRISMPITAIAVLSV
jgi:hypothetical protein